MAKKWIAAIISVLLIINYPTYSGYKMSRYEAEFLTLFNTQTKIVAYTNSKEEFTRYSELIYSKMKEYHELYDIYNDYEGINNIKTINDNAGIAPVKVDRRIIDLLIFAKKEYQNTGGKMNVAMGSVLKIWHKYRTEGIEDFENAKLPPVEMLEEAAKHTDINKLIIDEEKSTVFLKDPYMSLDVGSVAKGYAVEEVSKYVIKRGFVSGIISAGGNVRTIGGKGKGGKPWNVGIQNPDKEDENPSLFTLNLKDMSLVTSGSYERYYTVDGKKYHHIIDPNTLFPSKYFTAVTIICKDSGIADALSTAIFNMPFEEGQKLISILPNTEALWIFNNGEIKYSKGFKNYIKK